MKGAILFQYACMIVVSFISGVIASKYFSVEVAQTVIQYMDPRVLELSADAKSAILPVAISVVIVLLCSTHPYLYFTALIMIAVKAVFFGFGSVVMMEQGNAIAPYVYWWFPFQLIYIILLICLYMICRVRVKRMKKKAIRLIPIIIIVFFCLIYLEMNVISYIIK